MSDSESLTTTFNKETHNDDPFTWHTLLQGPKGQPNQIDCDTARERVTYTGARADMSLDWSDRDLLEQLDSTDSAAIFLQIEDYLIDELKSAQAFPEVLDLRS